jgi:hypothetical protein
MVPTNITKPELFSMGVALSRKFLSVNDLYVPQYLTFEEVFQRPPHDLMYRRLRRLESGPVQGYATGWYYANTVFVNLKKAARAVMRPGCSSWSFPCYKIDREPCGVAAHETAHHLDHVLGNGHHPNLTPDMNPDANAVRLYYTLFTGSPSSHPEWAKVVRHSKPITSYEPNLHESFAETGRLFILNPDLLEQGSKPRFKFFTNLGLRVSETRDFRQVLDHSTYIAQAERWIAKEK